MKNKILYSCIFLTITFFVAFKPGTYLPLASGQEFDLDNGRFLPFETGAAQIAERNSKPQPLLANKEVKFIAGRDGKWFTKDDEVYQYYLVEFDERGRMAKKKNYDPGVDKTPFTKDDALKEFWAYEYNAEGNPLKEAFYKASSPDKYSEDYYSLYECNALGQKIKDTRYKNGEITSRFIYEYGPQDRLVKGVEYKGSGPDGNWFTDDDEIKKYHGCKFTEHGRLLRAEEYLKEEQGSGPDDAWFTPDDVISSVREFLYDKSGLISKVIKYIGKGKDNTWFTADDIIQYYTVRYYAKK